MGKVNVIANAVRELRKALSLSQEELGKRTGKHKNAVQRWEDGSATPAAASLACLYELAREIDRTDIASIFLTGSAMVIDSKAGNLVQEMLPMLDGFFVQASLVLTKVISDPNLSNTERGNLVGRALGNIMDGRQFLNKILEEVRERTHQSK